MTKNPIIAETKKKMLAKKQKARFALYLSQVPPLVMPFQFQTLPQPIPSMKLTRRAKATIHRTKRMRSSGHFAKEAVKGRRKRREKRMEMAATTMV